MSLLVFPNLPTMAWDTNKKQKWNTKVQKSGSGIRKTLARWAFPEWEIKCSYTCLSEDDLEEAAGFIAQVRGQFQPFLWLDPEHYSQTRVQIGLGSGALNEYQLLRNFAGRYVEPVRDIVPDTLTTYANDIPVAFTLLDDGIVQINAAPGATITASFEYYWRVAFADDDLDWTNFWYGFYRQNSMTLVTVK